MSDPGFSMHDDLQNDRLLQDHAAMVAAIIRQSCTPLVLIWQRVGATAVTALTSAPNAGGASRSNDVRFCDKHLKAILKASGRQLCQRGA